MSNDLAQANNTIIYRYDSGVVPEGKRMVERERSTDSYL